MAENGLECGKSTSEDAIRSAREEMPSLHAKVYGLTQQLLNAEEDNKSLRERVEGLTQERDELTLQLSKVERKL